MQHFILFTWTNFHKIIYGILPILLLTSCEKLVTVDLPKTRISSAAVYQDDLTATSAIRGIYSEMIGNTNSSFSGSTSGISLICGLSSDELTGYSNNSALTEFYGNSLSPTNDILKTSLWDNAYKYIYYSNTIIEGLERSSQVTTSLKQQLEGEAKFIRAFCYFYLVNLFGDIPIVLNTDYRQNAVVFRDPASEVYVQIINDLLSARFLLKDTYPSPERVRPNKATATALLARVYLFTMDWPKAEAMSSEVIGNSNYTLMTDLNQVFLNTSKEAIWQLMPVRAGLNTNEGEIFVLNSSPGYAALSSALLSAFEPGDKRKTNWINSLTLGGQQYPYPFKYKIRTGATLSEYYMVFRLAEQYLIRSEARLQQNKVELGIADLNALRTRARSTASPGIPNPLPNLDLNLPKAIAILALEQESRVEMFCEWGHRWFNLKHSSRADAILSPVKGNNWQPSDVLFPIPQSEINLNPNLK